MFKKLFLISISLILNIKGSIITIVNESESLNGFIVQVGYKICCCEKIIETTYFTEKLQYNYNVRDSCCRQCFIRFDFSNEQNSTLISYKIKSNYNYIFTIKNDGLYLESYDKDASLDDFLLAVPQKIYSIN